MTQLSPEQALLCSARQKVSAAKVRSQKMWETLCAASVEDSAGTTNPTEPGEPRDTRRGILSLRPIAICFDDVPEADKTEVALLEKVFSQPRKKKTPSLQLQTLDFPSALKRVPSRAKNLCRVKCRKNVWAARLATITEGRVCIGEDHEHALNL
jgi:hypothetical protein